MTEHLGERVAALADGELAHPARERALAHLAPCDACRAEVDGQRRLKASGDKCVMRPWLQTFTLGQPRYGARQLTDQIKAARENGVQEYLLWNASNRYDLYESALVPPKTKKPKVTKA